MCPLPNCGPGIVSGSVSIPEIEILPPEEFLGVGGSHLFHGENSDPPKSEGTWLRCPMGLKSQQHSTSLANFQSSDLSHPSKSILRSVSLPHPQQPTLCHGPKVS